MANRKRLTPKQTRFCDAYIETGNASEAYRQVYRVEKMKPATIKRNACELMKNNNITTTIFRLQESHRERHNVTVDSLCVELEEARSLAIKSIQASAAVTAIMGKAKLHGLGVEKQSLKISGTMTLEDADAILREIGLDPANG